ncbi:PQQ-binding-like beta-propeller repeat protein [Cerasicoccus maritimus]|uniref:PQQ-binding-like beta-propeller repeat protein n=1 Tax=Cerasicoccus maritimus TaxID=490089 RepID=UPI0028527BAA|nr:PQQ-binding-like beta-propeller repeat protein [Cerasicoccus maritimus]
MNYSRLTLTTFAALTALNLHAVRTELLTQNAYGDFFTGELDNVSLDNMGTLSAGPELKEIAVLDDSNIWTAVASPDGKLYLGTGTDGVVYSLDPTAEEPKAEVVFKPDTIMTRALALDAEGNLFVGTSPQGAVYRIAPGGRPEVFFDPDELYIWDMAFDADGNLYVATGGEARIYKLEPDHQLNADIEPYFKSDRTHFTRLAWDDEGALIAGSGPKSYLYRITGEDEGKVLYSAGTDEIANVIVDGKNIYFTTWHKGGGSDKPPKNLATLLAKFQMKAADSSDKKDDDNSEDKPAAAGAPSFLLKLDAEGFVSPVWSPGGANMQFTTRTADGQFLVGSDIDGRIYSVNTADDWSLLNQAERGGEVSTILTDVGPDKKTYVLTSNPSAVYELTTEAEESLFTAKVIDAGAVARWGRIRPLGAPTLSSGLKIETRTGNAAEPDDTWSPWAELDNGAVSSPAARYLQYRINFADDAQLRGLTAYYGTRNLAPLVGVINVMPVGLSIFTAENSSPTTLNPKELAYAAKTTAALKKEKPDNKKVLVSDETGHISVAWKAFDPNGDDLRYTVEVKQDGEEDWVTLAEGISDPAYSTPTRGYANGYYSFKITASDSPSNLPAEVRSGSMISQPFLIDNSSPTVTLHNQTTDTNGATVLVFAANDEWGNIVSANYRLDGQEPVEAVPSDLLFDSNDEIFRLILPDLKPGSHSIVFEALDENNNRGLAKAVFKVE